jgi:hypothetical protein
MSQERIKMLMDRYMAIHCEMIGSPPPSVERQDQLQKSEERIVSELRGLGAWPSANAKVSA